MRLGFAVKVLGDGGLPSHDTRRWQSGPHLSVSLERLGRIFDYLDANQISMYRMASDLVPYATHPDLPQFHTQLADCEEELVRTGIRARELGLRLSFHPGQYCVLNSERPEVQAAAVRDLELHAEVLDLMGLGPEAVMVLHVGGVGGDKRAAIKRFLRGVEMLSVRARARLVIENDDRSWSLADVVALHGLTGLPVVFDSLHHRCHNPEGIPEREALRLALRTWPLGVVPKLHYSSPKTVLDERRLKRGRRVVRVPALPPLRAHADLVDPIGFEHFLRHVVCGANVDVMLEAKAKDLALMRLRDQLRAVAA